MKNILMLLSAILLASFAIASFYAAEPAKPAKPVKQAKQVMQATAPPSMSKSTAHASPQVLINTSLGGIIIELDQAHAPITVKNFLAYVNMGFYDRTLFHRVIKGFMIQGGGYSDVYDKKTTDLPIKNESNNGLLNTRGTIAMARTSDPHSATAQFFINVGDNSNLDYRHGAEDGWGYAVFGKVIQGMDIVNKIQNTATGRGGSFPKDVPVPQIVIEEITLIPSIEVKIEPPPIPPVPQPDKNEDTESTSGSTPSAPESTSETTPMH